MRHVETFLFETIESSVTLNQTARMSESFVLIYEADCKYDISQSGTVRSLFFHGKRRATPKILKPGLSDGYYTVALSTNGVAKTYRIHKLLAMYFIPNPKKYTQINHKDGNRSNNAISNLEWCTAKQNIRHSVEVLDKRNGCKSTLAKFNEQQLVEIRTLKKEGKLSPMEIAIKFNCTPSTIGNICAGRRYKKEYKRLKIN